MVFKKQYYCFVAGLPDITFDTTKLPFSLEDFRLMLEDTLSAKDLALVDKYFLDIDNQNLLQFLKNKNANLKKGKWTADTFKILLNQIQEEDGCKSKAIPPYFTSYIKQWLDEEQHQENQLWEDLMSALYMEYGMAIRNSLIAQWFEFNLNVNNVFAAIFARKHNMSVDQVVVGNNEIAHRIRNNANARDFGLDMELAYFDQLQRLAEEDDIFERERKTDKFKWEWLDQHIVFDYFNIEYIFAYLCKLQLLERWAKLNAEEGEKVFRELIGKLKNDVEVAEEN